MSDIQIDRGEKARIDFGFLIKAWMLGRKSEFWLVNVKQITEIYKI